MTKNTAYAAWVYNSDAHDLSMDPWSAFKAGWFASQDSDEDTTGAAHAAWVAGGTVSRMPFHNFDQGYLAEAAA